MQDAPRLLRGAIVAIDALNPPPKVIAFQYNPDSLSRTLQVQGASDGDRSDAQRLVRAAVETLKVDLELDAEDAGARDDVVAATLGVHPQLAALESLVHPAVQRVRAAVALAATGTLEVIPPSPVMTLFVWGARRVLPVRVTDFSVVEEAYDAALNPIRAKVSLGLRVLSYDDLPPTHAGHHLFIAHQIALEALARGAVVVGLERSLGADLTLLPTV
jgi:hypothetical protein